MTRNASAILLTRGRGADLEILLVERAPQLRFFGGYHALPGGVRDPVDGPDDDTGDTGPLLRCAVRELFEETGVLLGVDTPVAGPGRRAQRERLLAGATGGWSPPPTQTGLQPVCRIVTPPFAPVRYDTLFVHATLPEGEALDIWPGELTGGRFWRPADALAAWRTGAMLIVPPVIILLELLVSGDVDEFRAAAAAIADSYREGELHRVRFSPGILLAPLATATLPPATTTNCLIVGQDELYIVDPATRDPDEQQRLFRLLDALCGEGRRLGGILLTHHHPDHVGAVAVTSQRYHLEVRAHALTLERTPGEFRRGPAIADGDRIDLGRAPDGSLGWTLTAWHTPGHDRGHLVFHESRYDAVIVGDMASTVSTILIDPPEGHMRTYLASLQKLLLRPMTTLYPAHGPAMRDGHRLLRHYLDHRKERHEKIAAELRGLESATVEDLVPRVYADVDPRMHPVAARSLLAGLEMFEEAGDARRDGDRWEWTAPAHS